MLGLCVAQPRGDAEKGEGWPRGDGRVGAGGVLSDSSHPDAAGVANRKRVEG